MSRRLLNREVLIVFRLDTYKEMNVSDPAKAGSIWYQLKDL